MIQLHNTLSRKTETFTPGDPGVVRMYSCGPTVYDHIHVGNLSAFIIADTLRRVLLAEGYKVQHVMNFTDVDDKTIRRSQETYGDLAPELALKKLTNEYEQIFLADMEHIGNDVPAMQFVRATDDVTIQGMRNLIGDLYAAGIAYIAEDGVYFSIEKYRANGKTYGQLLTLSDASTSTARIQNDEYDKDSVHDFALWKNRKDEEPAWDFELDGHNLLGRPGWHLECSVMSSQSLGQPFDIHTGGIDLIFPHHENEIAQSTAIAENPVYAKYFVHNEHLLVGGKKMSKSLNNFYTLRDIQERGFEPLAFRLMVLQGHYRSQSNFTWDNIEAAQNRLRGLRALADLVWQPIAPVRALQEKNYAQELQTALSADLGTPKALALLSKIETELSEKLIHPDDQDKLHRLLGYLDGVFGLNLLSTHDIDSNQKSLLSEREAARTSKNWSRSDELRDQLSVQGIGLRDTAYGQVWYRT